MLVFRISKYNLTYGEKSVIIESDMCLSRDKMVVVTINFERSVYSKLKAEAQRKGVSMASMVRRAVRKMLNGDDSVAESSGN